MTNHKNDSRLLAEIFCVGENLGVVIGPSQIESILRGTPGISFVQIIQPIQIQYILLAISVNCLAKNNYSK